MKKTYTGELEIKDHLEKGEEDTCNHCEEEFEENQVVVEKKVFGVERKFCSEKCYKKFLEEERS